VRRIGGVARQILSGVGEAGHARGRGAGYSGGIVATLGLARTPEVPWHAG
jgi:hypothetical protein